MSISILKLGTRRSALAWAQSGWVAREIERLNPEVRVELVGIETRGDVITDVPLSQIEGKEFFSAEIDQALSEGKVDLTVHSLKDLSLERPSRLRLAATPKREDPRDVLLISPTLESRLKSGQPIRIGTSSPRRLENLPAFLPRALPNGRQARFEWREIRGNVDTRIGRLREKEDSDRKLDGVVLAAAGLNRLWNDEVAGGGRDRLKPLLGGIRWMVLPIAENPTAPGQGALAIECRSDDSAAFDRIRKLHDHTTFECVGRERKILELWGGGCHQRFGATSVPHPKLGPLLYIRGAKPDGTKVDEVRWERMAGLPAPPERVVAWDGPQKRDSDSGIEALTVDWSQVTPGTPVFVAHSRALPPGAEARLQGARVWTSGMASWTRLAERGVWVEGCTEGLGFSSWVGTLENSALSLPSRWTVLTHETAAEGWSDAVVLATYRVPEPLDRAFPRDVTHAFWSSGSQYDFYRKQLPKGVHHSCGPGKTAEHLARQGIKDVTVFPSVQEWRLWLKTPNRR